MHLRTYPDPILAVPCTDFELAGNRLTDPSFGWQAEFDQILKDLSATRAYAVAAPQVGFSERFFVVGRPTDHEGAIDPVAAGAVFINPEIVDRSESVTVGSEGCLSIPGFRAPVKRATQVTVRWVDRHGAAMEETFLGLTARVIQHEVDHLDGKLFVEHLDFVHRGKATMHMNKMRGRK